MDEFKIEDRYLGDGVYASYDGYQIWLAVNDHTNKVVALEPAVYVALREYYEHIVKALAAKVITEG